MQQQQSTMVSSSTPPAAQPSMLSQAASVKVDDGTNLSDSSSISSMNEAQHDSRSEDFLKQDAKGICGCFERIPLWLKLTVITCCASLIILIFAIWLIVVQGSVTSLAVSTHNFSEGYNIIAGLVNYLQKERGAFAAYYSSPSVTNLNAFIKAMNETDVTIAQLSNDNTWARSVNLQKVYSGANNLATVRQTTLSYISVRSTNSAWDPVSVFAYYTYYVESLISEIAKQAKQTGNQNIILTHNLFLQLREAGGRLRSFGTICFNNRNASLNFVLYDNFNDYVAVRDNTLKIYSSLASDADAKLFETKVLNLPEYALLRTMEMTAITAPLANFSTSVDYVTWTATMNTIVNGYQAVFTQLLDNVNSNADNELKLSIGIVVLIVFLVLLFTCAFAALSLCLSRTIVGPWVRMNRLQEEVTHKFIPRHFLRLLDVERITQVKLGASSTRQLVMMKITVNKFWNIVEDMPLASRINFFNRIITTLSPVIKQYGGYIESYTADEITVFFRQPLGCITCAHKLHKTIFNFNTSNEFPRVDLSIALHGSTQVHMAVGGDESRMQGIVLSKITRDLKQLVQLAKRFNCKTVLSHTVLEMCGEQARKDTQLLAMNCFNSPLVVYEIVDSAGQKTREIFSKSVRDLFVDHNVFDALNGLQTFSTEAARFYLKVCKQVADEIRTTIASLSVDDVMKIPELDSAFDVACTKERSVENLHAFRHVIKFKQAFEAKDLGLQKSCVNAIAKEIEHVNITENMKKAVLEITSRPEEEWNLNMFEALEAELMILLTDTFKRMKNNDGFKKTFARFKEVKSDLLEELFIHSI